MKILKIILAFVLFSGLVYAMYWKATHPTPYKHPLRKTIR